MQASKNRVHELEQSTKKLERELADTKVSRCAQSVRVRMCAGGRAGGRAGVCVRHTCASCVCAHHVCVRVVIGAASQCAASMDGRTWQEALRDTRTKLKDQAAWSKSSEDAMAKLRAEVAALKSDKMALEISNAALEGKASELQQMFMSTVRLPPRPRHSLRSTTAALLT